MHGSGTLAAQVTHVSRHGFRILLDSEALLLPFEQLSDLEWPRPNHLYWPQLDIDLAVESIRNPQAFPLTSKPFSDWTRNGT